AAPPVATVFPSTTLFRSRAQFTRLFTVVKTMLSSLARTPGDGDVGSAAPRPAWVVTGRRWITSSSKSIGRGLVFSSIAIEFSLRSEEHTSELQSLRHLVC